MTKFYLLLATLFLLGAGPIMAQPFSLMKDINPDIWMTSGSFAENFTPYNGLVYFKAANHAGNELWKSDGTAAGTVMVKDIYAGQNSSSPQNSRKPMVFYFS